MQFCPTCANLLLVDPQGDTTRFYCQTCPYIFNIRSKVTRSLPLVHKEVADVMGGPEAWKNASKTEMALCPRCKHKEAYFYEVQTRSADEPSTLFFKCARCGNNWREG
eukprot:gnl/Trimastix_PCT/4933.p3 GENE.gnl/Trimastix_PCT/4933~~gnl/Trimastix_PCT/4933.p3  ORF type:complete len:108 (+),score=24.79 gnl/Trimastix_PCT/4933:33-356(+)